VRNLDPESPFLVDNHGRLCEEFLNLDYAYLDDDKPGKFGLAAGDWPGCARSRDGALTQPDLHFQASRRPARRASAGPKKRVLRRSA
jgi:hypothetical protein